MCRVPSYCAVSRGASLPADGTLTAVTCFSDDPLCPAVPSSVVAARLDAVERRNQLFDAAAPEQYEQETEIPLL